MYILTWFISGKRLLSFVFPTLVITSDPTLHKYLITLTAKKWIINKKKKNNFFVSIVVFISIIVQVRLWDGKLHKIDYKVLCKIYITVHLNCLVIFFWVKLFICTASKSIFETAPSVFYTVVVVTEILLSFMMCGKNNALLFNPLSAKMKF